MSKILNTARLPYSFIKGSQEKRFDCARRLNAKFFDKVCKKFADGDLHLETIERDLKSSISPNLHIQVCDYGKKGGMLSHKFDIEENGLSGYFMHLSTNQFDKTFQMLDMDTLMHESFHLCMDLTNPKHLARALKIHETGIDTLTKEFYIKMLYAKGQFSDVLLKNILKSFLSNFNTQDQIDFLQNSRYRLTQELLAYQEGDKYLDKVQDINSHRVCEKICAKDTEEFHFSEKIKLLESFLKNIISNVRISLKSKNS